MGEKIKSKKYVVISGLALDDNNRGTAALGYGAISFLEGKGKMDNVNDIYTFCFARSFSLLFSPRETVTSVLINNKEYNLHKITLSFVEQQIIKRLPILIFFTRIAQIIRRARFVAAINGGDGFSDIYSSRTFFNRLAESITAINVGTELIELPQTLGPFKNQKSLQLGLTILKKAKKVYIRDEKFIGELQRNGIDYELANDLSAYMKPAPADIEIVPNSVGINVSGLTYSNHYGPLLGHFDNYPYLIVKLIEAFTEKGINVYLIPHSYNYKTPETNNDDLLACLAVYNSLQEKEKVTVIAEDYKSPQIKWIISQMRFFIGTRMHANFAAIFTKVPLVGLSYSYKFEGAFKTNNISTDNIVSVMDMKESDIENNIEKIMRIYCQSVKL